MSRAIGLIVVLAAFWLLLSGHYTVILLSLGALSIAIVAWIAQRMQIVDREQGLHVTPGLPRYLLWLSGQIFLAALAVARWVWSPRPTLHPVVGPVPTGRGSELSQVIYANSITLTPGTLAMSVDDDAIEVHSLQPAGLAALREDVMLRRVRRLEDR